MSSFLLDGMVFERLRQNSNSKRLLAVAPMHFILPFLENVIQMWLKTL